MRWKITSSFAIATFATLTILSALALAAPRASRAAQSKEQRYNARLIVQSTSNETFDFTRDVGNAHELSKGTANIETTYSENFVVVVQNGFVSLAQSQGPPASSVTGTITTDQEAKNGSSPKDTFTENFSMNPRSADQEDAGTGTSAGTVIQTFQVNGQGLAIRINRHATLKGKCTSSMAPGNICIAGGFEHGGGGPSENSTAHTGASPMAMDLSSTFDFYDKADPSDPSKGTCGNCFLGGVVQGGLGSNYSFTGTGVKTSDLGGWKRSWQVTVKAQLTILGKA